MTDRDKLVLIREMIDNATQYYTESLDALCITLDTIAMIADFEEAETDCRGGSAASQ